MKKTLNLLLVAIMAICVAVSCKHPEQIIISVISNNTEWGTVEGTGSYDVESQYTIKATPKEGFKFSHWNDGSTENPRTLTATENTVWTAYFSQIPQGDGSTVVFWNGNKWGTEEVYAVDLENNIVTLEIYQDSNDSEKPVVVARFPMEAGDYAASQSSMDFICLYYDYPNQTGDYNGQQIPPYQPAQGLMMHIDAIDVDNGIISGYIEGSFVNIENYMNGDQTLYPLRVEFNATQWTWQVSKKNRNLNTLVVNQ